MCWLFLLGPAAIGASTIFLILVRDWGASTAGSLAFVSPIIAMVERQLLSRQALYTVDAVGMTLMLGAAWMALKKGQCTEERKVSE